MTCTEITSTGFDNSKSQKSEKKYKTMKIWSYAVCAILIKLSRENFHDLFTHNVGKALQFTTENNLAIVSFLWKYTRSDTENLHGLLNIYNT